MKAANYKSYMLQNKLGKIKQSLKEQKYTITHDIPSTLRPSPMQMPMPMPNLALKNVKMPYLIFDPPMHKCYFKCYFVILLFFSCKNQ